MPEDAAGPVGRPHTLGSVQTEPLKPSEPATSGPAPEVAAVEVTAEPPGDHDRATLEALEAELAVLEDELARVDADGAGGDVTGDAVWETR